MTTPVRSPRAPQRPPGGFILWFTGLSGAGKSTLSRALAPDIAAERAVEVLDGDEVRTHLSKGLGFSREDRDTNVHRIGFVARLLARNGTAVVTAAISPYADTRAEVRALAEADGVAFVEVYARASLESLAARDPKGLYRRALAGEIPHFTGVSDPYEPPHAPEVVVDTDAEPPERSAARILAHLRDRGLLARRAEALASYRLSLGASIVAAAVNVAFGLLVAWVLARYRFPGRSLVNAIVDLPFALPTAVSGIALTAIYARTGWVGRWLAPLGVDVAFAPLGVVVALTFIGLPFVVRTVQPVLEELPPELEEAASLLGATRWQTFARVILPGVAPAALTGFALAFARALGEYGSVVFISGNMPLRTEIAPLLIMTKLEGFDYAGATAIASVLLVVSFVLLLGINRLQGWARARVGMA